MGAFFDRFSKIPLSQKILLLFLVLASIFVAFYMFVYNPLVGEIEAKRADQARMTAEQGRVRDLRRERDDLQDAVELMRESNRDPAALGLLPTTDNIAQLYRQLEDTAREVPPSHIGPLIIHDVERNVYVEGPDYVRIPMSLSMSGTYDQALDFCWRLANMSRIVHVRSVNLDVDATSNTVVGAPQLRIALNIEAFFRPES